MWQGWHMVGRYQKDIFSPFWQAAYANPLHFMLGLGIWAAPEQASCHYYKSTGRKEIVDVYQLFL